MNTDITDQCGYVDDYDVIVIGAGIIGSMIARELSRFEVRFALLDKEAFPGFGVSKAGLFADEIARMVGDHDIRLTLRKGAMVIFDKSVSHLTNHMILGTFSEGHSQDIAPTAHGNLILGVHYTKPEHKDDTKVSREGLREIIKLGKELVSSKRKGLDGLDSQPPPPGKNGK